MDSIAPNGVGRTPRVDRSGADRRPGSASATRLRTRTDRDPLEQSRIPGAFVVAFAISGVYQSYQLNQGIGEAPYLPLMYAVAVLGVATGVGALIRPRRLTYWAVKAAIFALMVAFGLNAYLTVDPGA